MADTAAQAQARKVIGLPADQEWTDSNVSAHLKRQGFTDPSFTNEVLANGAGTSDSIKNMTPVNVFGGYNLPEGSRYTANDPMARNSQFTDTRTGKTVSGGLSPSGDRLVTGFSRGNPQNTTSYDTMTGKKYEAMPHPWLDAAKNTAMIWGGPETAGLLMGAYGGAAAAGGLGPSGAGYGGGGASTMAGTAGANFGAGAGAAGSTAGGTAAGTAGHALATQMALNAATNAAMTKASGGSWGQAALAGGIGAGTAGLGPTLSTLGPAARTAANFGIAQGTSAAMRAASSGRNNSTSTYGRGSESSGIGPSGGMAPGFSYSTSTPNLADAIAAGKRQAIRNQPFRAGYDVTTPTSNDNSTPPLVSSMPRIYGGANVDYTNNQRRKRRTPGIGPTTPPVIDSGSIPAENDNKQAQSY